MKSSIQHTVGPVLTTIFPQSCQGNHKKPRPMILLLLLFAVNLVIAKNPKDNFCRRFAHQTNVIDDKLYIDGGWVNFDDFQQTHANYSSQSAQHISALASELAKLPVKIHG